MLKALNISLAICLVSFTLYAQPKLKVTPGEIRFENWFDRLENIYLINEGDSALVIDTIYYKSSLYFVRYDKYWHYPIVINPGDSILMDCILAGYFDVTSSDTTDTMYVYSNSINPEEEIKVRIEPYDDSDRGTISGKITEGGKGVPGARVYALYEGNYIIRSAYTNNYGNYSMTLPEGTYIIAAEKDSFNTTFFGQKTDPYSAQTLLLESSSASVANISLSRIVYSSSLVTGSIYDNVSRTTLRKAIVLIKKGRHHPRKENVTSLDEVNVTVFADPYGNYSAYVPDADYYYIQSFSDYFLPAYYSNENSAVFWEEADSVFISDRVEDKNIYLPRDSSYGAGVVEGKIIVDGLPEDSLSGILVFARTVETNTLYSYAFSNEKGEFKITNLPYGNYRLYLQNIGLQSIYSDAVSITPESSELSNVVIHGIVASNNDDKFLPGKMQLSQNYPNPFNPTTLIEFFIPYQSSITLSVFNVLGEEVARLYDGVLSAGRYDYEFNGSELSSGAYFVVLKSGTAALTRKIMLIK